MFYGPLQNVCVDLRYRTFCLACILKHSHVLDLHRCGRLRLAATNKLLTCCWNTDEILSRYISILWSSVRSPRSIFTSFPKNRTTADICITSVCLGSLWKKRLYGLRAVIFGTR